MKGMNMKNSNLTTKALLAITVLQLASYTAPAQAQEASAACKQKIDDANKAVRNNGYAGLFSGSMFVIGMVASGLGGPPGVMIYLAAIGGTGIVLTHAGQQQIPRLQEEIKAACGPGTQFVRK